MANNHIVHFHEIIKSDVTKSWPGKVIVVHNPNILKHESCIQYNGHEFVNAIVPGVTMSWPGKVTIITMVVLSIHNPQGLVDQEVNPGHVPG